MDTRGYMQYIAVFTLFHSTFMVFGQTQFTVILMRKSWEEARKYCRHNFVDLAVAQDEQRYQYLMQWMKPLKQGSFWVGLQNRCRNNWTWVDGSQLTYNEWTIYPHWTGCGSLYLNSNDSKALLARWCKEQHFFICQGPTPPEKINVNSVGTEYVALSWERPSIMVGTPYSFNVSYFSLYWEQYGSFILTSNSTVIYGLKSGSEYIFNVSIVTNTGSQSSSVSLRLQTRLHQPEKLCIDSIGADSVSLRWEKPATEGETSCQFKVNYASRDGEFQGSMTVPETSNSMVISNLKSGTEYMFSVTAVRNNGAESTPVSVFLCTCKNEVTICKIGCIVLGILLCSSMVLLAWLWKQLVLVKKDSTGKISPAESIKPELLLDRFWSIRINQALHEATHTLVLSLVNM
ncbi:uncharacterized protein [Lepisosteus oculatus]|uniref:uncharacterized protein isoform X2 n=1 Tax=Lepisosteus oculatus TaxID=7918 RepID=UPI00073FD47B|nr:PREDICTED: uncharacterized protein LOC107079263 isoform X2 [Lepisosteus oculatus]